MQRRTISESDDNPFTRPPNPSRSPALFFLALSFLGGVMVGGQVAVRKGPAQPAALSDGREAYDAVPDSRIDEFIWHSRRRIAQLSAELREKKK